ncbi:fucose isomerase, partial [Cutibacterium acnes]
MGVCADLTVTASWDCIAEILDLTPDIPHARGFNATERSGAVTVAAAMAAYTQLGILAFAIYGHDVQNADDALTDDVSARILSFGRAALAVGLMRVRSYLAMGTVSMGIAGCHVPEQALQD